MGKTGGGREGGREGERGRGGEGEKEEWREGVTTQLAGARGHGTPPPPPPLAQCDRKNSSVGTLNNVAQPWGAPNREVADTLWGLFAKNIFQCLHKDLFTITLCEEGGGPSQPVND